MAGLGNRQRSLDVPGTLAHFLKVCSADLWSGGRSGSPRAYRRRKGIGDVASEPACSLRPPSPHPGTARATIAGCEFTSRWRRSYCWLASVSARREIARGSCPVAPAARNSGTQGLSPASLGLGWSERHGSRLEARAAMNRHARFPAKNRRRRAPNGRSPAARPTLSRAAASCAADHEKQGRLARPQQ